MSDWPDGAEVFRLAAPVSLRLGLNRGYQENSSCRVRGVHFVTSGSGVESNADDSRGSHIGLMGHSDDFIRCSCERYHASFLFCVVS